MTYRAWYVKSVKQQLKSTLLDSVLPVTLLMLVAGLQIPAIAFAFGLIYFLNRMDCIRKCEFPMNEEKFANDLTKGHFKVVVLLIFAALYSLGHCMVAEVQKPGLTMNVRKKSVSLPKYYAFACQGSD